jgi:hypothetical protein
MTLMMVGEVKYAPARDIVYLFPSLVKNIADRLEDAPFAPLHQILRERGVTLDDLGQAMGAYCKYMNACHQDPDKKMWDVLGECGWHECKPEAQIAVMYYAGAMLTGTFFKGIRDVVPLGNKAPAVVQELVAAARQFDAYVSMPPWKRWLYGKFKWLRKLLLRTKGIYTEV